MFKFGVLNKKQRPTFIRKIYLIETLIVKSKIT